VRLAGQQCPFRLRQVNLAHGTTDLVSAAPSQRPFCRQQRSLTATFGGLVPTSTTQRAKVHPVQPQLWGASRLHHELESSATRCMHLQLKPKGPHLCAPKKICGPHRHTSVVYPTTGSALVGGLRHVTRTPKHPIDTRPHRDANCSSTAAGTRAPGNPSKLGRAALRRDSVDSRGAADCVRIHRGCDR